MGKSKAAKLDDATADGNVVVAVVSVRGPAGHTLLGAEKDCATYEYIWSRGGVRGRISAFESSD